jgi:hypothetical protein
MALAAMNGATHFFSPRVVIVTDYNDTKLPAAARDAGACDYVVKEILLVLRRLLAAERRPKPPE